MTLKELSQLYDLKREIAQDERRLQVLEDDATSISSPIITDMPRSHSRINKIEVGTENVEKIRSVIESKKIRCINERLRLEKYISEIDDSLTRRIFTLRFVEGHSWRKVAIKMGGNNTEESVKKICYRYLEKT